MSKDSSSSPSSSEIAHQWRHVLTSPFFVLAGGIFLFLLADLCAAAALWLLGVRFEGSMEPLHMFLYGLFKLLVLLGVTGVVLKIAGAGWRVFGVRLPRAKTLLWLPVVFVLYFLTSAALTVLAELLIPGFQLDQTQDIGLGTLSTGQQHLWALLALVVVTPLVEEFLFRGIFFMGLRKRLPFWASAFIVSVLFAFAHGQWNVAIDTFALSIALCYLTEQTKSLLPAILLHMAKNAIAFSLLFLFN